MVFCSRSGFGTKSASRISRYSPLAKRVPFSRAPALKPVRSVRWMCSASKPRAFSARCRRGRCPRFHRSSRPAVGSGVCPAGNRGRDGVEQAVHHVHLVEDRQLDGHQRQILEQAHGLRVLAGVLQVEENDRQAVRAVAGEAEQHENVGSIPNGRGPVHEAIMM
jgi:hypothetical protein